MLNEKNYKIYGLVSSEFPDVIRYIGLTITDLKARLRAHHRDAKVCKNKRTNWINKVIKNNHNVSIVLIEDNILNLENTKNKEIQYIKLFKSFGANLVNGTMGGDYPAELDEKTKLRLSESRKRKVDQYDMFGNFIKTFPSRNEAAIELNIERTTISTCIKGGCLAGDFIFSHHGTAPKKIEDLSLTKRKSIPIKVTNIITNEINYFKNITLASIFLNQQKTCTRRYLKTGNLFKNIYSIKYYNQ